MGRVAAAVDLIWSLLHDGIISHIKGRADAEIFLSKDCIRSPAPEFIDCPINYSY